MTAKHATPPNDIDFLFNYYEERNRIEEICKNPKIPKYILNFKAIYCSEEFNKIIEENKTEESLLTRLIYDENDNIVGFAKLEWQKENYKFVDKSEILRMLNYMKLTVILIKRKLKIKITKSPKKRHDQYLMLLDYYKEKNGFKIWQFDKVDRSKLDDVSLQRMITSRKDHNLSIIFKKKYEHKVNYELSFPILITALCLLIFSMRTNVVEQIYLFASYSALCLLIFNIFIFKEFSKKTIEKRKIEYIYSYKTLIEISFSHAAHINEEFFGK